MSTASPDRIERGVTSGQEPPITGAGGHSRLAALDVYRGLVIITMIFVNYLAGIKGIPSWAKHWPEHLDGYTFVDVVFPAFLFIVGVALPLSFARRLQTAGSPWSLLLRTVTRSVSLIMVGVIMVNSGAYSAQATGMSKNLWFLLAMVSVVALWHQSPSDPTPQRRRLHAGVRCVGGLSLAILLFLFRGKGSEGQVVWLQHSWWGILGLIGWAYLVCALIYLVCRDRPAFLMAALGLLLALYVGDRHGVLNWFPLRGFIAVGPVLGSTAASVMIGVLVGTSFLRPGLSPIRRCGVLLLFGAGLYLAGVLVRPLHGINKVAATEAYALVCGGLCCLSFALVYFLTDVKKIRTWAKPIVPVGQNALLAYILPGMFGNFTGILGLSSLFWVYDSSCLGALNAGAVTLLMVLLTWTASRCGLFVRL